MWKAGFKAGALLRCVVAERAPFVSRSYKAVPTLYTATAFACLCLDTCALAGEQIVYGDSKGHVVMLLCGTREWPARDLISTEEHQDYIYIHQDHTDWVSQVRGEGKGGGGHGIGQGHGRWGLTLHIWTDASQAFAMMKG